MEKKKITSFCNFAFNIFVGSFESLISFDNLNASLCFDCKAAYCSVSIKCLMVFWLNFPEMWNCRNFSVDDPDYKLKTEKFQFISILLDHFKCYQEIWMLITFNLWIYTITAFFIFVNIHSSKIIKWFHGKPRVQTSSVFGTCFFDNLSVLNNSLFNTVKPINVWFISWYPTSVEGSLVIISQIMIRICRHKLSIAIHNYHK